MLRKTLVPILLEKGVDTKTSGKASIPGKLYRLENAVRTKVGEINKRNGCEKLGDTVIGGATVLSNSDALATFNDELLQFTKQSVYGYSSSADSWVDKGAALSCRVGLTSIVKNNYEQTQVDSAISGDIQLIAWEDSRGGVRCSVVDLRSNTQLLADTVVNGSGSRPRCASLKGSLLLFYVVGADLRARIINPVNPSPLGGETTLTSNVNATAQLDVCEQDEFIAVGYNGTGTNVVFLRVNQNLTILTNVSVAESGSATVAVVRGPSALTYLLWSTGSALRCAIYNFAGTQTVSPFLVETLAGIEAVTGYAAPDNSRVTLFYQVDAASAHTHDVRSVTVTTAGAVGSPANFIRGVGLAAKAFPYSPDTTDRGFVGLVHESTLQSTYFVARNDGLVVARLAYGFAGGLSTRAQVANLARRSSGVYVGALLTKNPAVVDEGAKFLTPRGVSIASIDFTDQANFSSIQLGDNALIMGGVLQTYDGQSLVEHGFHLYPENISTSQSTGGSLTLLGNYQYQVLYQWTDAKGQIHRSAPSAPISVTMTGSNNRVVLTIPTLRITAKRANRTPVEIVVFRTESNQTLFYRASSPVTLTYNDHTVQTITYTDDLSDAALIAREPLYTTGDVLENVAPPSSAFGTTWKNRAILAGTEDDLIWASKELVQGMPVEFASELTIALDPKGGRVTAVAALFDKLLIFKESAIFYIYGDGPDARGVGQWSPPERVVSDLGCVDANSIAETPQGVIFKSRKGIYIIGQDLQPVYIGAQVEEWNSEAVVSSVVVADKNEVRISTSERTLVYNYFFGVWSVFADCGANDSVIWNNSFVYIRRIRNAAAVVVQEREGIFKDLGAYYAMGIGIDWMAFQAIAGFQRIYALMLFGTYKDTHKMRVRIAHDYSEDYSEEKVWEVGTYLGNPVYGGSSPYGAEGLYGGTNAPYMLKIKPARQKCTALRLLIEDIQPDGSGESFALTSLSVELGIKRGTAKLPAEARL